MTKFEISKVYRIVDCKDIGIRKFEVVASLRFLYNVLVSSDINFLIWLLISYHILIIDLFFITFYTFHSTSIKGVKIHAKNEIILKNDENKHNYVHCTAWICTKDILRDVLKEL